MVVKSYMELYISNNGSGYMIDFDKEIGEARQGFEIFKGIEEELGKDDDTCIICLPTDNKELNIEICGQLDEYAKAKYIKNIVLICRKGTNYLCDQSQFNLSLRTLYLNDEDMNNFVRYLKLVNNSDRIIVVSAEMPFGNLELVGKHGISISDYVAGTYLWRTNATD